MADMHYPTVKMDGPDDPERCHGVMGTSQCQNKRLPPSVFCSKHGGAHAKKAERKREVEMYKATNWQHKIKEFATHQGLKTLNYEIGVARMTLDEVLDFCKDQNSLIIHMPQIQQLVVTIKACVEAMQKLQEKGDILLDKAVLYNIADSMIKSIRERITDQDMLDGLAKELNDAITNAISTKNSERFDET